MWVFYRSSMEQEDSQEWANGCRYAFIHCPNVFVLENVAFVSACARMCLDARMGTDEDRRANIPASNKSPRQRSFSLEFFVVTFSPEPIEIELRLVGDTNPCGEPFLSPTVNLTSNNASSDL